MSVNQLHITNGDVAASRIKSSGIGGDVLSWRDPMHHGPYPTHLDLVALESVRAKYLTCFGLDESDIRHDMHARNEQLFAASRYDEIVMWFEHDLLDQLQVLELLSWFSDADIGSTLLTMICIDHYPGIENFRGIGQLDGLHIQALLPTRARVTEAHFELARAAWLQFGSDDPTKLEQLTASNASALPFLHSAMQRHFQDYPWHVDGLTRTERQILGLAASGVDAPEQLFKQNMDKEGVLYIGDWYTYKVIEKLCAAKTPLLLCKPDSTFRFPPAVETTSPVFQQQVLSISDAGSAVLAGSLNAGTLMQRDEWLGGVHFQSSKPMWMWNEASSTLVLVPPQTDARLL